MPRLAIMAAMQDEVRHVLAEVRDARTVRHGGRDYHCGTLWGHDVVVVFSHWGKVAAALTATSLVTAFDADRLVFTGVAGGVDPTLRVGDVVVATRLVQHDMDARPIFARHEIPLLGRTALDADPALRRAVAEAARAFLADVTASGEAAPLRAFGITAPRVVEGLVASGDRFFASHEALAELRTRLPETACVEMEGAAVAQVCVEFGVPFAVVRTISDSAGDSAAVDFTAFLTAVASHYSLGILRALLASR